MSDTALVFAGQGAQFVGMGRDLADAYPECMELYRRADDALGYALSRICFEGPEEELTKSNHCQPAIFVTSVACCTALNLAAGVPQPVGAAGLSLGEWTALHAAGALGFEDTLRVLEARGRFMQEACEARDGAMVSVIGLSLEELKTICGNAGVELANLNSSEQVVLSGERARVEEAERLAREAGAKKTVMLKVAGAYHSTLMQPAADRLAEYLRDVPVRAPSWPVPANVTGRPHESAESIRETMVRQVTQSVRWFDCVEWLRAQGAARFIELGPGRVLSGLIRRIARDAQVLNVQDRETLTRAGEQLGEAGARS